MTVEICQPRADTATTPDIATDRFFFCWYPGQRPTLDLDADATSLPRQMAWSVTAGLNHLIYCVKCFEKQHEALLRLRAATALQILAALPSTQFSQHCVSTPNS